MITNWYFKYINRPSKALANVQSSSHNSSSSFGLTCRYRWVAHHFSVNHKRVVAAASQQLDLLELQPYIHHLTERERCAVMTTTPRQKGMRPVLAPALALALALALAVLPREARAGCCNTNYWCDGDPR